MRRPGPGRRRRFRTGRRADNAAVPVGQPASLLAPALVLLVVLFMIPVVYSFYLGLTNLDAGRPDTRCTGTSLASHNLIRLLADHAVLAQSLWLTRIFILADRSSASCVIGLALAMLMQTAVTPLRDRCRSGIVIVAVDDAGRSPRG